MVDHLGRYVEAGAQQINLAMRAPWQLDHLEMMASTIGSMD